MIRSVGNALTHESFYRMERRRDWQNPDAILSEIGLREGDVFVDVGCGEGFFTIPAARITGKSGRVYAVDIDEKAITLLRKEFLDEGLANIVVKVGSAEETVFCESCADFVFFGIDLHDFDDPTAVLSKAHRMLKPAGRLIDLDWRRETTRYGPPLWKRFSEEKAVELIRSSGFRIGSVRDSGELHYIIDAVKL